MTHVGLQVRVGYRAIAELGNNTAIRILPSSKSQLWQVRSGQTKTYLSHLVPIENHTNHLFYWEALAATGTLVTTQLSKCINFAYLRNFWAKNGPCDRELVLGWHSGFASKFGLVESEEHNYYLTLVLESIRTFTRVLSQKRIHRLLKCAFYLNMYHLPLYICLFFNPLRNMT